MIAGNSVMLIDYGKLVLIKKVEYR